MPTSGRPLDKPAETDIHLSAARMESILEAWGDLIDPLEYLRDDPDFGYGEPVVSRRGDRAGGANRPFLQNESDLAMMRAAGRLLVETSPAAIGVVRCLGNYVIGSGFSYKAAQRTSDLQAQRAASVAQEVIDEFLDDNDWVGDLERELFLRSRRDGEYFLTLNADEAGRTHARLIEPEQITEPDNRRALDDWLQIEEPTSWTLGIHTAESDVERRLGYFVKWNASGTDWDYLPAAGVEHAKLNVDRNIKRGVSDFYAVRQHLEDAEKLLRNTRRGAAVQAAIAFIREHAPGVAPAQISTLRATEAEATYNEPSFNGARRRYIQKYEPGTIIDVGKGQQYKPGPLGASHGPNFIAIEQATLRMAGVRWCMPEYMISGDASNNNHASILEAGAPFTRNAEAEQAFYVRRFQRIIWKVLANAQRAGRFQGVDPKSKHIGELRRLLRVNIEPPSVAVRDRHQETLRRKMLFDAGVLSARTWAAQESLDYDKEQRHAELR